MNLLIIEDKDLDLIFIKKTLEFTGEIINIDSAGSIEIGLDKLSSKNFDCVLLDLHLPDAENHHAFDLIYNSYSNIPIILLTGSNDDDLALDLIDKGAQDYISKNGINAKDLIKAIKFAIRRIRTDNKLRELNATKDKFFSIMAHDLKNPLSIFALATETLHKEFDLLEKEEMMEYLEDLKINAQNIFKLLENLLTWSRTQRKKIGFQPDIVDLSFIIKNIYELFNETAKVKNINLTQPKLDEWKVYSDSNLINTILRNLVNNALKYTREGGNVKILIESKPKHYIISVQDDGVGMSDHVADSLFRIDVNTSTPGTNNEKGTGLGLIVCKEFSNLLQGEIGAKSKLGEGSTFYFTVPKN
ncbi:ATP-binding protein [Candidatus Kapabacteria bacterium]|nr:ATP-binding protein [Candidatus Kapabacteria bacterium]